MKRITVLALSVFALTAFVAVDLADAKRMGGGRSVGAQRQVTPTAPVSPSASPAAPTAPMQQAMPAKAAPAAAAPSGASRWLGPIAGLAAGLGLAALMSHLGLSEAFGSFLLLALLVVGGVFLVRMLLNRRTPSRQPLQYAGAGISHTAGGYQPLTPPVAAGPAGRVEPVLGSVAAQSTTVVPAAGRIPADFNVTPFLEQAKLQFRKLQTAYDAGDRKALSEVMTPEMFAEISTEIGERTAHMPTEIMRLDANVLDVATEGGRHWASVHFSGLLREDDTVLPKEFDEVWNLAKPVDGSTGWLLAGIQQLRETT